MMQWSGSSTDPLLLQHSFVLARAGYDVWMGNNRGCRFSQKHITLDPKSAEFWNFDWEDMGTKDTHSCSH